MDLEIRTAGPEDVEAMVPLIFSSGPDAFNYVFSHMTTVNAQGFLSEAFVREDGEFSYRNHICGVLGGQVIASGAAFSKTEMLPALKSIFGVYGLVNGIRVCKRGLEIERIVVPPHGDMQYIAHIGVDPEFRSRGFGEKIVRHLIDAGRELGLPKATLDVSCENPRAEALYTRMGFVVTYEKTSNYRNSTSHVPSHRRMEIVY